MNPIQWLLARFTRSTTKSTARQYPGTILRWVDGDTAVLLIDLGFYIALTGRFRVLGVDTPEMKTGAPGEAAKAFSEAFAPAGTEVEATTHKPAPHDSFGRWLVDVSIDGRQLSGELIDHAQGRVFRA